MGLKLQKYINKNGYEVEEGYFEITQVSLDLVAEIIQFTGKIWLSKEHKEEGFYSVDEFQDRFKIEKIPNENIVQFAYDHIKEIADKGSDYVMENCPVYKGFIGYKEI